MTLAKKSLGLLAAGALALTLSAPATAQDYKSEYKISTVVGKPFPWGEAAHRWEELVEERTDGRIQMKVYPGAQLVAGDQTKEFTAMRRGVIDMAIGSTINWSPQVKQLNIFALPFLMPDYTALDALTQGPVGDRLFEIIRDKGVVPLAWAENGFREVSNSVRPIERPEDLEGLKMRVVGSPLFNDIFSALGANPTQMPWSDAKPALSTGAVDGQENPLTIFKIAKMHQLNQKYITLWHYVADPLIFGVNADVFQNFTEEDQKIVREAAQEAGAYGIELARKGLVGEDKSLIQEIEGLDVEITTLSDAERERFYEATREVYKEWKQKIGPDLVEMAEKSIANR
jgi:tripartite ATP-independent transporter DctP family solute receptor